MSKLLGKYVWIETQGWRKRAALKRIQRRVNRRRELRNWRDEL